MVPRYRLYSSLLLGHVKSYLYCWSVDSADCWPEGQADYAVIIMVIARRHGMKLCWFSHMSRQNGQFNGLLCP